MITKRKLTMAMAMLAVSSSAALAGTKYQANLVNASALDPPGNPTLASGKLSLKDTGDIKAKVKGVTDGAGALVTTGTSFASTGILDGTEYVVILKMSFTALGVGVEVPIAMDLKKGGGKGALALGTLVSMIPPGTGRSLEVTGGEVWGPLGAPNIAACQAELTTGFAIGSSLCKGGAKVGVAGVDIP